MAAVTKTIDYRLGEHITLEDLRRIVDDTADLPDETVISHEVEAGQRDAEYHHLIIRQNG